MKSSLRRATSTALAAGIATIGAATISAAPAAATGTGCSLYQTEIASVETKSKSASICKFESDGRLQYRGFDNKKRAGNTVPIAKVTKAGGKTVYITYADEWDLTYHVVDQTSLVITGKRNHVWFDEKQKAATTRGR
ncbi:hypothetical protein GOEFS_044_00240 [Gordonia effusa NBRC 100432]|uniref:Uncharacterized protein n=1 Tax=Gordonia effusa NBRC 100432 TaxID=1077974 RepID=H0QYT7_9ACTN|nr:hypothetical protein [Gordonia effusa]GAB17988.1 hypothetical protein GOEFS_044_00240 [Gordonia effusa NBRC 100432]